VVARAIGPHSQGIIPAVLVGYVALARRRAAHPDNRTSAEFLADGGAVKMLLQSTALSYDPPRSLREGAPAFLRFLSGGHGPRHDGWQVDPIQAGNAQRLTWRGAVPGSRDAFPPGGQTLSSVGSAGKKTGFQKLEFC
jgi:hypothetical protein